MESCERTANCADNGSDRQRKILMLFFSGFLIALLGVVIIIISALFTGGSSASFGIVVFIGPIPIVVGAGPDTQWLIFFAMILAVLSIVMFTVMRKQADKKVG